ncbi:uncharacterized protein LOC110031668 [Phalaenopsis equestris]|uniref:uncharacterized protein LOC110031668 n=1 Tax=Phalaenopsis equestris TaxID=78828 RepID=UPI0009E5DD22|nr:uncharacterized protein LOC110031668 [Phalaenopsis equestris]
MEDSNEPMKTELKEQKKMVKKDCKKENESDKSQQNVSRFLNRKTMNCRCRPSAVRYVLDKVWPTISEETWNNLKAINMVQFFELPPYRQNHILTMHILNCWDIDRIVFNMGGKELRFDSDQVALLIGMPNRGSPAKWNKVPSCGVDARQIKSDLLKVALGESSIPFDDLFLKFLLSNLFFPSSNFSVAKGLYTICENLHDFSSFNWPATICEYLIEQVTACSIKIKKNQPLGYMNGFVFLLTLWFYEHTSLVVPIAPEARPRMLRWPISLSWNSSHIHTVFKRLNPTQIFDFFVDLKEDEHHLLALPVEGSSSHMIRIPQQETHSIPHSPDSFDVNPIVPYHISPQRTHTHTDNNIRLEEIYYILRDQQKFLFDFQESVNSHFTNLDSKMLKLQSQVNKLEKEKNKTEGKFAIKKVHESSIDSLIQRVKVRVNRKKRKLSTPYTVVPQKKSKPIKEVEEHSKCSLDVLIAQFEKSEKIMEESVSQEPIITDSLQPITKQLMTDLEDINKEVEEKEQYITEAQDVNTEEEEQNQVRAKARDVHIEEEEQKLLISEHQDANKEHEEQDSIPENEDEYLDKDYQEMKRSFPWEEAVTISLIDSSDSDSDSVEDKQDRAKRNKKDCSSENLENITSEGTLIRLAGMYQEHMKRIPIPTFSGSVVPFTSWQGLAKSLKQLYGQPLHYLTNTLLKQWDSERLGSDNEQQPLDTVVHPVKAQTLVWLTEELHRLTASPIHLAKLWASDPMYHSHIDPFLSY